MAGVRILIVSTPVGPLGSGIGGGVELTLHGLVLGLTGRGHDVEVVAPAGSLHVGGGRHQIPGRSSRAASTADRDASVELPADAVLAAMWEWAREHQAEFDVIVNLAFDWLPIYLTPFFEVPVAHLVSMASVNDAMDAVDRRARDARPGCVAMHSRAQAATFPAIADRVRDRRQRHRRRALRRARHRR